MIDHPESDDAEDFRSRAIPLLSASVIRHNGEAWRRGWFFEAIDEYQNGYRVIGHPDEPAIKWALIDTGSVRVNAIPGKITVLPLQAIDREIADEITAAWWDWVAGSVQ